MKYFLKIKYRKYLQTYFRIIRKFIFKILDKKVDDDNLMINIGGGQYMRRHWRTLDFHSQHYKYRKVYIDYCFDLMSGNNLPFKDNTVALFFSSHTLEHIPQKFCQIVLNEMYRCLKSKGGVRLMIPDFDLVYGSYGSNDLNFFKKYAGNTIEEKFLNFVSTFIRKKISPEELRKNYNNLSKNDFADFYIKQVPTGSQKLFPGHHLNWLYYEKVQKMLQIAGFKTIYRSYEQGSNFSEMRSKKSHKNFGFDSTHPEISFIVEAVK